MNEDISSTPTEKRPVWWVFSGMGVHWNKMGQDMMKFEVFRKSIERAREVLLPTGLDIFDMLLNSDEKTYENVRNSRLIDPVNGMMYQNEAYNKHASILRF